MAQIPVVSVALSATAPLVGAVQGGDQYQNDGETELYVLNTSGSAIVVTRLVQTQPQPPDTCADDTFSCAATSLTVCPPLTPRRYSDGSGNVQVRYPASQAVNLQVLAVRSPRAR